MPVMPISEDQQAPLLEDYNRGRRRPEIIPWVQRNATTGWPLLQISLFSISPDDKDRYEPALGGGKCHSINIGAYNLAVLLSKIPGPIEIGSAGGLRGRGVIDPRKLRVERIGDFLAGYRFHHRHTGISIVSATQGYGQMVTMTVPEGQSEALQGPINNVFAFAFLKDQPLDQIAGWNTNSYSIQEIQDALDHEVATLSNGQIFIDLGMFLEQAVNDPEITSYFRDIFKVDAFSQLFTLAKPLQAASAMASQALFEPIEKALKKMETYADTLSRSSPEQEALLRTLYAELHHKVTAFFDTGSVRHLTSGAYQQFVKDFEASLHGMDEILQGKPSYLVVIKNISIALTEAGKLFDKGGLISQRTGFFSAKSSEDNENKKLKDDGLDKTSSSFHR